MIEVDGLTKRYGNVLAVDGLSFRAEPGLRAAARRVGGYSLGMRQRLSLAGALLGDPEALLLACAYVGLLSAAGAAAMTRRDPA